MIVWRDRIPSAIRSVSWVKLLRLRHSGSSVPSIGRLHGRDGLLGGDRSGPPIQPDLPGPHHHAVQAFRDGAFHDVQSLYVSFLDIPIRITHFGASIL